MFEDAHFSGTNYRFSGTNVKAKGLWLCLNTNHRSGPQNSSPMQLHMKSRCGKCAAALIPDGPAYICSYECTFCDECAGQCKGICPNCGGELVRRPRRQTSAVPVTDVSTPEFNVLRSRTLWLSSFAIWTGVALAASVSVYELYRGRAEAMTFGTVIGLEFSQILSYIPLTPFAFALALRFPLQRNNWPRRVLLHFGFALVFSTLHSALRAVTPYAYWNIKAGHFASAIWNSQTHHFEIAWLALQRIILANVVDDITGTYLPIILVAHAISYYSRFRDRELHSTKLEVELARSHLQALKTNLQPHFLFNTLHSISSLMHTDVKAADKMMTRLSDLLRMSLENDELQITTLNRELEFVNAYLEIEKIRFEDRLKVILNIVPETLDAHVPHLLLQPLVENAVRHGVSRLAAGGTIWITSSRQGNDLHLTIKDNGPGLGKSVDNSQGTGLGVRATRERLATLYGNGQSFNIQNVPGGGVEVLVRIPFRDDGSLTLAESCTPEGTIPEGAIAS